ncbi:L-histidine N(alpha)-methyltransferase [Candidimonas nitroreducens]|uniref:L-histidine N(Alpha)-methyltransferase n=1 Tax=Candidimonas nitroreducens TaxID=683354 RepID=A0A225MVM0_9BURK|nr:L-histidine N(alpha)-methyltransferase [Candidimonas nitroreducens]OWT65447.1 L-histidine N(alpha)-methyltransferase [Candidimonas nitroreducens]
MHSYPQLKEAELAEEPVANSAQHTEFALDLAAALAKRPRQLSPKYFYDAAGSALFDRICELPEYYLTRCELGLLSAHASEIAGHMDAGAEIVEFGAGSLAKIRLLLDAMRLPGRYLPIDISGAHLTAAAHRLQQDYPGLDVRPVVADYTKSLRLPRRLSRRARRIGFFPGSTIGNLRPDEALRFLKQAAALLRGGALLLGADLVKAPAVLHAAYNDAQGVTAAFNLNLLKRANRELGADFDPAGFAHSAFYNAGQQRIEMHLMSLRRQQVHVCGQRYEFVEGETLHTENSYKFTIDGLHALAARAGLRSGPVWTDKHRRFGLLWLDASS